MVTPPPSGFPRRAFVLLTLALLAVALVSLGIGAASIGFSKALGIAIAEPFGFEVVGVREADRIVVWSLRAPRVVLAILVGAALGSSGAAIQGLFRNPLAEPGLIGISAGAALGAALTIVLGAPVFAMLPPAFRPLLLPISAFVGAGLATLLVLRLGATLGGRSSVTTVLLAGVALNAIVGAVVGLLAAAASDAQLRGLLFFTLGGLEHASWSVVLGTLPFVLVALLGLPRLARPLDILALGEGQAGHLGVHVQALQRKVIALVAVAVGASVAAAGLIGFVGLIVPHLIRLRWGPRQATLLPLSALLGATLLLVSDIAARVLTRPAELPVGMMTALVGAPYFLWLLRREAPRS